ncbi:MAG: phosphatase PAP2 family protein [Pseudomonadota bacterium]
MSAFVRALFVVGLLEGRTSRVHPEALVPATSLLRSQQFRFGFLENGFSNIVEGWPSVHTATHGAFAPTMAGLVRAQWLNLVSVFWAIWVGLATVFGINSDFHSLSDAITGGMIAWVISEHILNRSDHPE